MIQALTFIGIFLTTLSFAQDPAEDKMIELKSGSSMMVLSFDGNVIVKCEENKIQILKTECSCEVFREGNSRWITLKTRNLLSNGRTTPLLEIQRWPGTDGSSRTNCNEARERLIRAKGCQS